MNTTLDVAAALSAIIWPIVAQWFQFGTIFDTGTIHL
jgi:hypothetical protein